MKLIYCPYLVGGPARCGKSTLVAMLSNCSGSYAPLKVDALFKQYIKQAPITSIGKAQSFLREYLLRPRYINPERTLTARPIDDFVGSLDHIIGQVGFSSTCPPICLIAEVLKIMAREHNKDSWIALDIHAELYYPKLRAVIKDLRLIILLREPVEAVCAALYWRTYPSRDSHTQRNLLYWSILWCFSAMLGQRLQTQFPDEVTIEYYENIKQGKTNLPISIMPEQYSRTAQRPYEDETYFSYDSNRGFYCPDGTWQWLLSKEEILFIRSVANYSEIGRYARTNLDGDDCLRLLYKAFLHLLKLYKVVLDINPILARAMIDTLFFPYNILQRYLESIKVFVRRNILVR